MSDERKPRAVKLKVYGCNLDGQYRSVVAARSKAEAAERFRCSPGCMRDYGGITGNAIEVEVAMREPGIVWRFPFAAKYGPKNDITWERVEPR